MENQKGNASSLISIIIPVYKVEKYLCKCLDSIITQTYNNLEIILVDDASPDCSGKICDVYAQKDNRIRVIHLENNRGVSYARNMGIYKAQGNFISFIDADDYIECNMIERLIVNLVDNQADISICGIDRVGFKEAEHLCNEDYSCVFSTKRAVEYMINGWYFGWNIGGKLFPGELVKTYPFSESIYCGEDLLFIYRIFQYVHQVSYISDQLYHYTYRGGSATHSEFCLKQYTELYVYEFLRKHIRISNPELLPIIENKIININLRLAVKVVESKKIRRRETHRYLWKFHKNIRYYMSKKALFTFKDKKTIIEVALLYINVRIFWMITILYKKVEKFMRVFV